VRKPVFDPIIAWTTALMLLLFFTSAVSAQQGEAAMMGQGGMMKQGGAMAAARASLTQIHSQAPGAETYFSERLK